MSEMTIEQRIERIKMDYRSDTYTDVCAVESYIKGLKERIKELEPEPQTKSEPVTTVTVWMGHSSPVDGYISPFTKLSYTKPGLPDIDRIIKEMMDKALVVKVVCSDKFVPAGRGETRDFYLWDEKLGRIAYGWNYRGYICRMNVGADEELDSKIEQAITDYLEKAGIGKLKVSERKEQ